MITYLSQNEPNDFSPAYKQNKISLGSSDKASLIIRSKDRLDLLNFGEDNSYTAWYVTDPLVAIPKHYKLVTSTKDWLTIYDDTNIVFDEKGDFRIYRAGEMGCIIKKMEITPNTTRAKNLRLTYQDRLIIEKMLKDGARVVDIANVIGVHRATIYQELKRYGQDPYDADDAQKLVVS